MRILPFLAGAAVFLGHFAYRLAAYIPAGGCACERMPVPFSSRLSGYLSGDGPWFGLSYALAVAFTAFALTRFAADRKKAVAGAVGGTALTGGLLAAGCWLLGCCGSPMLVVYLGVFGARGARFAGPLVLGVTVLTVGLGWWWMTRRRGCGCGCAGGCGGEATPGA